MRVAVVQKETCQPKKCHLECISVCPINRAGDKCIWLGENGKSNISEDICIDCGLCIKACPFHAIEIVRTPEQLKEKPMQRSEMACTPFNVTKKCNEICNENSFHPLPPPAAPRNDA